MRYLFHFSISSADFPLKAPYDTTPAHSPHNPGCRHAFPEQTQEELAEKAGITSQTVSSAELGKKALRPENIIRLCSALDISTDYLLLGEINENDHSILLSRISDLPPIQYRHLEDIINSFILALEEREAQSEK